MTESKNDFRNSIRQEIEEKDIHYSNEFCSIAKEIVNAYETFKTNLSNALKNFELAKQKNEKKEALKKIEEIYIENRIYLNGVRLPVTNFYLDNVSGKKYFNRVKRANNAMYNSLHNFQLEMRNLMFYLEEIDKNFDKKVEKEIDKRLKEKLTSNSETDKRNDNYVGPVLY